MSFIRQKWVLIALAVLVVVGGVFFWQQYSLAITRTSTGGFTGRGDGKNLTLKGYSLTAAQLKELKTQINQADFFNLDANYPAPHCADEFTTSLTIRVGVKTKKVTFDDCNQPELPASLKKLDTYIKSLKK